MSDTTYQTISVPVVADDPRYSYLVAHRSIMRPTTGFKVQIPVGVTFARIQYYCSQNYMIGYAARVGGPPSMDYSTLNANNWHSSPFTRMNDANLGNCILSDQATRNSGGMGVVLNVMLKTPLTSPTWLFLKPLIGYGTIFAIQFDFWYDKAAYIPFNEDTVPIQTFPSGGVFAKESAAPSEPVVVPGVSRNLSVDEMETVLIELPPTQTAEAAAKRKEVLDSLKALFKGPVKK